MSRNDDIQYSILIVSASAQFNELVKRSLNNFITIDIKKSASSARRSVLEKDYDLIVVNIPLPGDMGEEFAMDAAEKTSASILIVVPQDVSEDVMEYVSDEGILVLPKPFPRGRLDKALRFLVAMRRRMHSLEKKTLSIADKMEEIRIVSRAKILLVEKQGMSEDEAHRYIGKYAMDHGISRKDAAERVINSN